MSPMKLVASSLIFQPVRHMGIWDPWGIGNESRDEVTWLGLLFFSHGDQIGAEAPLWRNGVKFEGMIGSW